MITNSLFNLEGKSAIITGGSSGIGEACAQVLAEFGASIIIIGRDKEKLQKVKQNISSNYEVVIEALDVNDTKELKSFFLANPRDILVNSVGTTTLNSILDISEDEYIRVMDTNVKSAFFQTKYFIQAKKNKIDSNKNIQHNGTSIIHISSQMGLVGGFDRSVYCTSKHALEGLCKAVAIEIGAWNMRINTICPTFIETPLTRKTLQDPEKYNKILNNIVLGRIGQTDDIKGAVVYLASDASSLVTGSAVKVDGGWSAH